mgnify:CR=1 FL=1
MKEWLVKLKEAWANLAMREKRMVTAGGAFLGIFIVYQWIWTPLLNHVATLRNRIAANQKTLVWMQSADKAIQKMEGRTNIKAKRTSPVGLLSLLQKQINHAGLEQQLIQLKQTTNDSVEMHFQKVEFDKLLKLLMTVVKEQSVFISQMSVTAENTPGLVNADIILKLA